MKNIRLEVKQRGLEVLVVTLTATTQTGETISKDIDFGGNFGGTALWAANEVVKALQEMEAKRTVELG